MRKSLVHDQFSIMEYAPALELRGYASDGTVDVYLAAFHRLADIVPGIPFHGYRPALHPKAKMAASAPLNGNCPAGHSKPGAITRISFHGNSTAFHQIADEIS